MGRIDEIILFSRLSENELGSIAELMLTELKKRSLDVGAEIETDLAVSTFLAKRCCSAYKELGARPLRREITDLIETPLADMIINRKAEESIKIKISTDGEKIFLSPQN